MTKRIIFLSMVILLTIGVMIPQVSASVNRFETLSIGDTGKRVKVVKRALGAYPITNRYNQKTRERVRHFQNRHDLRVTGQVNYKTYTIIKRRWDNFKENRSRAYRSIINTARNQIGDPYVFGAAGPGAFDCSGLIKFVYERSTRFNLYHQSSAQYKPSERISRSRARPGDLVFFHSNGNIYHTAIYAGKNRVIHASRPGTNVHRARIWTKSIYFTSKFNRHIK